MLCCLKMNNIQLKWSHLKKNTRTVRILFSSFIHILNVWMGTSQAMKIVPLSRKSMEHRDEITIQFNWHSRYNRLISIVVLSTPNGIASTSTSTRAIIWMFISKNSSKQKIERNMKVEGNSIDGEFIFGETMRWIDFSIQLLFLNEIFSYLYFLFYHEIPQRDRTTVDFCSLTFFTLQVFEFFSMDQQ